MNPLYAIFIFPLRLLMETVLLTVMGWTENVGAAIVVLSLLVNTFLLPLYYLAEKWQNRERRIQSLMAPKLGEIKKNYRGEERYLRTAALYKEHHYHPIQSLRGSFGFLIQVPFFIAAYTLLSHNPLLADTSFLFLDNLAEPDGLISFWNPPLNLMPLVMTAVNLLSSLVYAKRLSLGERVKLILMGVFFLVLLYHSPSGLVLYWTLNNIYSLVKNLIYNPIRIEGGDIVKKGKG